MEFSMVYFAHWVVILTVFMIYLYTRILKAKYTHCKMIAEPNLTSEGNPRRKENTLKNIFLTLIVLFENVSILVGHNKESV